GSAGSDVPRESGVGTPAVGRPQGVGMMEYSEEQLAGFREEFAKHRQTRVLVTVLMVVCAVAFAVFAQSMSKTSQMDFLWPSLFIALILIGVVFLLATSRCPACGSIVGRPFRAKFCDQCGVPLRER